MSNVVISIKNISMIYGKKKVLDNISLDIKKGETIALLGPSGTGKSTILRLIMGLQKPTSGEILILGKKISSLDEDGFNILRKDMGMVFQYSALFDFLNVAENVAFGLRQHTNKSDDEIRQMVKELLKTVDLAGHEKQMPNELSGGMKKRVSLARAIATSPSIVLYDEPTAGLDPIISGVISRLIVKIQSTLKATSVIVTHDIESTFCVADRIILLYDGKIIVDGTPEEIFACQEPMMKKFIHGWDLARYEAVREAAKNELE